METETGRRKQWAELVPAASAIFFLLLGLGVVWFARAIADVTDGAVLASFVIVPALLYVVLRGDLAELSGPGGWTATFVRVARSKVRSSGEQVSYEDVQIIEKETLDALTDRMRSLDPGEPVLLTISLGRDYSVADVQAYLNLLAQFPRFRLVALLDRSGRFAGCTSPSQLAGLMRSEPLGEGFVDAITRGDERAVFRRYPVMLQKVVQPHATNAEALAAMTANNLDAIAIVSEDRRLRGVAEREQIVSKLVLALANSGG
jgi:CBS domain-containing protein